MTEYKEKGERRHAEVLKRCVGVHYLGSKQELEVMGSKIPSLSMEKL
jgi:hypothetical protein